MEEFSGSPTSLIADVDCTAEGKDLCGKHDIKGYPTIKYGDPSNLQTYQGARELDALRKFAEENLGPSCSPAHLELCDDEVKKKIETYLTMSVDRLEGKIRTATKRGNEQDASIMKKVVAHKKTAASEKKEEGKAEEEL